MQGPTTDRFVYDRKYVPLCIEPGLRDPNLAEKSMHDMTREYYRKVRMYGAEFRWQSPLTNGSTAGEFAMWMIRTNHAKRGMNTYDK